MILTDDEIEKLAISTGRSTSFGLPNTSTYDFKAGYKAAQSKYDLILNSTQLYIEQLKKEISVFAKTLELTAQSKGWTDEDMKQAFLDGVRNSWEEPHKQITSYQYLQQLKAKHS